MTNSVARPVAYDNFDGKKVVLTSGGDHYIHYKAVDDVGNEAIGYYGPYKINTLAASIEIASSESNIYKKEHKAHIMVTGEKTSVGTIYYQWSRLNDRPNVGWFTSIGNRGEVVKKGLIGVNYLHVKVKVVNKSNLMQL